MVLMAADQLLPCLRQTLKFELFSRLRGRRPLQHDHSSVRFALQRGSVQAELLPSPPRASRTFFVWRREPVLPYHSSYLMRRSVRERIPRKKQQHVGIATQQTLFRTHDDGLLPPGAQRRKPQVPIEPRLIRRIYSRRLARILWFVTKGIDQPVLSVVRALKFDLVAPACHHRKQSIAVRNSERLQRRNRCRPPRPRVDHPHHLRHRRIENPRQHHRPRSDL